MIPGLGIGLSALQAASRRVEVASHNVANANTEGYTRQRVELRASTPTPATPFYKGTGVTVVSVSRLRDSLADAAVRSEAGVDGSAGSRSQALSLVETAFGTYGDGPTEALSVFLASWTTLANSPGDPAARSGVLSAAGDLATSIRGVSDGLTAAAEGVRTLLGEQTGQTQGLMSEVAQLDSAIRDARATGSEPQDLLDTRDLALDKLSSLTGAKVSQAADGTSIVKVGERVLVQGGVAATLTTTSPPDEPAVLADGVPMPVGGALGGLLGVLTADVPALREQLDTVANGLRDSVNALHAGGTGLDGSTGRAMFTGTSAADLAVAADLTPDAVAASATGARGDNGTALALAGLATAPAVGSASVGDALRAVAARVGTASSDASRRAGAAAQSLASAEAARQSRNGVSVDEEMVDLLSAQHAYEAAARVISVADSMLQTLIDLGR